MRKTLFLAIIMMLLPLLNAGMAWAAQPGDYPDFIGLYTDSTTDNTWPVDDPGRTMLVEEWFREGGVISPIWGNRANAVLLDDEVMEGNGLCPLLLMTVEGLDPAKTYDVYTVYWSKIYGSDHWGAVSALEGEPLIFFNRLNPAVTFRVAATANSVDGCEGFLGQVSGVSEVSVLTGANMNEPSNTMTRAWWDGVAVVETTTIRPTYTLTMNIQVDDPDGVNPQVPAAAEFPVTPAAGVISAQEGLNVTLFAEAEFNPCPDKFVFDHWSDDSGDPNVITAPDSPVVNVRMTQDIVVTAHYIALDYEKVCGDECHPILTTDFNQDCIIDLRDFSMMASEWLVSTRPEDD